MHEQLRKCFTLNNLPQAQILGMRDGLRHDQRHIASFLLYSKYIL